MNKLDYKRYGLALIFLYFFVFLNLFCEEQKYEVKLYREEVSTGVFKIFVDNDAPFPQQMNISFDKIENLDLSIPNPYYVVIESNTKRRELFNAKVIGPGKYYYHYNYEYKMGDPETSNPDNYLYYFPYEHGVKHKMVQGYFGKFSHNGRDTYANDFEMNKGSIVCAARGGIVAHIKNDSNEGGISEKYRDSANYITIFQDDGTFASYAHLKMGTNLVTLGERVEAGQPIGYSGNSGYSSGPHLHFQVVKVLKMESKSIPVKFLNYDNKEVELKDGDYYYGYNPSKGKIDVVFGRKLDESQIEKNKRVLTTNKLKIDEKQVDDTVLFYVENGFNRELNLTFKIEKNENLAFSKKLPYSTKVPANTRFFLMLSKPVNPKNKWSYRYAVKYW